MGDSRTLAMIAWACACIPLAACGPGSGGEDASGEPDADQDVDADPGTDADADASGDGDGDGGDGGGTGTLAVTVRAALGSWWLGTPGAFDWQWPPVAGAVVAFDRPDGSRVEATTGADGRVEFDGFDWSGGAAAVTAWAEGYGLASSVGLDEDDADPVLLIPDLSVHDEGWIQISGAALNMGDASDLLFVRGLEANAMYYARGASWSMWVPPETPLTILATEMPTEVVDPDGCGFEQVPIAWTVVSMVSPAGPGSVGLDFASSVTPASVHGSFLLPARAESPLRSMTMVQAGVVHSRRANPGRIFYPAASGVAGVNSTLHRSADGGSYEYDLEFVELPDSDDTCTFVEIYDLMDGHPDSHALVHGYPAEGGPTCTLPDVPVVTTPSTPGAHPLHDPIEWEPMEPGMSSSLYITDHGDVLWLVDAPVGATTLTVPQPPGTPGAAAVVDGRTLLASVATYVVDEEADCFVRYSDSEMFALVSP